MNNKKGQLLSIFDQELVADQDGHVLSIDEEQFPEEFQFIIKRLVMANAEADIRRKMTIEDEIISEWEENERFIAKLGEEAEEALRAKQQAEADKQQAVQILADKLGIPLDEAAGMLEM